MKSLAAVDDTYWAGRRGSNEGPYLLYHSQSNLQARTQNKPYYLQVLPKATLHFWEEHLLPLKDQLFMWPPLQIWKQISGRKVCLPGFP